MRRAKLPLLNFAQSEILYKNNARPEIRKGTSDSLQDANSRRGTRFARCGLLDLRFSERSSRLLFYREKLYFPAECSSVNRKERGLLLYDLRLKRHLRLYFWSMARRGVNTSGNSHSMQAVLFQMRPRMQSSF